MSDTTRTDHAAAIRRALEHERRNGSSLALDQIERHVAALIAERDRWRDAFLDAEENHHGGWGYGYMREEGVREAAEKYGVTDLMRADDTPQPPGGAGDGV